MGVGLKRAALVSGVLILIAFCYGCGGGSSTKDSNSTPHQRSGISTRAFISNREQGVVQIVDYSKDELSMVFMAVDSGPTTMISSPDHNTTLVYCSGSNSLVAISNNKEQATVSQPLGSGTDSIVVAPDNKTAYAAIRNYPNASGLPGAVEVIDYTQPAITTTIPVANTRWLALDHAGKRLLSMSDVSDSIQSIDVTATTPAPVNIPGFSRPVAAFFSTDDTKAYVVSCGPECGGTQAAVQEITFATGAIRSVAVQGASAAAVNGSTMYVAGAPGGSGGTVQTVDLNAMTASAPVNIGSGNHTKVVWAGSRAWIAARDCGPSGGCLSIFDPATGKATVNTVSGGATSLGDVTGMAFIDSRNIMYVAEGGELRLYDVNGNLVTPMPAPITLDIVGEAWDIFLP